MPSGWVAASATTGLDLAHVASLLSHYLDTGVADRLAMHHVALWSRGAGHLGTVGISSMALAIMMIDVFKMSQVSMLFGLLHPCGVSLLNTASWVSAVRPTTMESRLNRNRQTLVPFATRGIFKSIYRPPVRNLTSHTPHEFISATNTTCATSWCSEHDRAGTLLELLSHASHFSLSPC